jgi:hypothetical protein
MPSVLVNLACAVCAVAAVCCHRKKAPLKVLLRFFTVLSNLLCALAALAVVVCRLGFGTLPYAVGVFKYVATAAVSVTLLTVLCFLGPTLGYKLMFTGPDLWLHLICPLLAVVSLLLWDKPELPFGAAFLGTLPVALYGAVYIRRVLFAPEQRRWPDFYGFNRGGKWPLSYAAMTVGAAVVSVVLWLL